ncbi:MAG: HupE/UreJ family protein [Gammaproteobacteria bacterium]|jgi:hypothetical protein|nr:HupE/UreJ family protein [Gammaproteobacteria bacterium]MBT3860964.1 HupE/UreJ family protein [Gammaproteobacteria bacterium]MBT3987191.1 HupE/UreJ family protein [Gammaproteobacteria bacterium]MBT4255499.1 HupE/UreJ family protein [Gammaproteobacteria bacterium]MBT4581178.1 HupE/UreJ family protein [Gammaproteobacteria bacterium]
MTLKKVLKLMVQSLLLMAVLSPSLSIAHDIPSRVTVHAFVKPEGNLLTALIRVPMEALGEISFPLIGPGYIQLSEADFQINDAARVYITESIHFYENDIQLTEKTLEEVRVSLPSNRSFTNYEDALENILSPRLEDSVDLFWRQGVLDIMVTYPIQSEASDFSVNPQLATLSNETSTVLRFVLPEGGERVFNYLGNPGIVVLDPRWYQAAFRFVAMGFEHILEGTDHLLFLFCLVLPLRSLRRLIPVVTAFTVAHSITLIGAAFGVTPNVLWWPPLIETLIALSIVYMAFENIVGARLEHRWIVTFGFGLVHGFGFSFLFSDTLQFAGGHLFSSLLAFNVGVELGQLLVLILVIPVLNILFSKFVKERIGSILLSALLAHSAWHWMLERGEGLSAYQLQMPLFDYIFFAGLMRWGMMMIVIAGAGWGLYELFRRFNLIESFSTYGPASEEIAD